MVLPSLNGRLYLVEEPESQDAIDAIVDNRENTENGKHLAYLADR